MPNAVRNLWLVLHNSGNSNKCAVLMPDDILFVNLLAEVH